MPSYQELLDRLQSSEQEYTDCRDRFLADDNLIDDKEQSQFDRIEKLIQAIRERIEKKSAEDINTRGEGAVKRKGELAQMRARADAVMNRLKTLREKRRSV